MNVSAMHLRGVILPACFLVSSAILSSPVKGDVILDVNDRIASITGLDVDGTIYNGHDALWHHLGGLPGLASRHVYIH